MTIDPGMLDAGEQVVWSGRPNTLRYAFRNSLVTLPFGIVFLTFSLFWVYGARSGAGGNTAFWLLGIPFVAVGAGMVLSPLWHLFRSARTTYVLTNRRALSVVAGPFGRRFSVPLRQ